MISPSVAALIVSAEVAIQNSGFGSMALKDDCHNLPWVSQTIHPMCIASKIAYTLTQPGAPSFNLRSSINLLRRCDMLSGVMITSQWPGLMNTFQQPAAANITDMTLGGAGPVLGTNLQVIEVVATQQMAAQFIASGYNNSGGAANPGFAYPHIGRWVNYRPAYTLQQIQLAVGGVMFDLITTADVIICNELMVQAGQQSNADNGYYETALARCAASMMATTTTMHLPLFSGFANSAMSAFALVKTSFNQITLEVTAAGTLSDLVEGGSPTVIAYGQAANWALMNTALRPGEAFGAEAGGNHFAAAPGGQTCCMQSANATNAAAVFLAPNDVTVMDLGLITNYAFQCNGWIMGSNVRARVAQMAKVVSIMQTRRVNVSVTSSTPTGSCLIPVMAVVAYTYLEITGVVAGALQAAAATSSGGNLSRPQGSFAGPAEFVSGLLTRGLCGLQYQANAESVIDSPFRTDTTPVSTVLTMSQASNGTLIKATAPFQRMYGVSVLSFAASVVASANGILCGMMPYAAIESLSLQAALDFTSLAGRYGVNGAGASARIVYTVKALNFINYKHGVAAIAYA
jgi:hypothetical protein